MTWTEILKGEVETTYATTARLLDKVDPDSLAWKPASGSNWMTIGQLLKHIGSGCGPGCRGFVTGDWGLPPDQMLPPAEKMPAVQSVEEARRMLAEDKALTLRMIDQAGEKDLANQEMEAPWAPGSSHSLGWHLLQMIRHLDRHKAQLFYYLKLQGKPVHTADLWG